MTTIASEMLVQFTVEEAEQLLRVLNRVLKDTELEVHRTDALNFKMQVQRREDLLRQIITKLQVAHANCESGELFADDDS